MNILVNGEAREVPEGTTVGNLLRDLDITSDRVAVEVSLQIVDRREFESRALREGDRVEILSFIGGGTIGQPGNIGK